MRQRIRARLVKGEPVRYLSHLDLMRAVERAVRRARLPIAFSEGFNPHMKISFGSALAVGVTSESEWVDFELTSPLDPVEFKERLNDCLPSGIALAEASEVPQNAPSLMAVLNVATYEGRAKVGREGDLEAYRRLINAFLDNPHLPIVRQGKNGERTLDLRPLILDIQLLGIEGNVLHLKMVLRTGSEGNAKPEEVIRALNTYGHTAIQEESLLVHRTGLYVLRQGKLAPPF